MSEAAMTALHAIAIDRTAGAEDKTMTAAVVVDSVWVFSLLRPVVRSSRQQLPELPAHDACGAQPWWERFPPDAVLRSTNESGPQASPETQPENLKRSFRSRPSVLPAPERGLNGSSCRLHKASDILRNVALQSRLAGLPALP